MLEIPESYRKINAFGAAQQKDAPYILTYYAEFFPLWLVQYNLWEFFKIFEMYQKKITTLSELPEEASKIFRKKIVGSFPEGPIRFEWA